MVEEDTGEPITTEGLRYGFRVNVIGMPSHPHWRTEAGHQGCWTRCTGLRVGFCTRRTALQPLIQAFLPYSSSAGWIFRSGNPVFALFLFVRTIHLRCFALRPSDDFDHLLTV